MCYAYRHTESLNAKVHFHYVDEINEVIFFFF